MNDKLREIVHKMDEHLDKDVAHRYQEQPLAQDWARVAKVAEEAGEAVDALIGITGQNPRKGEYGSLMNLFEELADVALTGLYAIQHFTKDADTTAAILMARANYHATRVGLEVGS
jgi:NTP pyrophosphatase (non-canonical NTP hydrolase)